ncbi:pyridoxamine 5'-phosphate oxidase family protein [Streptococcus sp. CSL10205-OR2]|uniref:pyridoxamine 5'-phosphate oxidase family protein n=1 Tax=Streptococcus sp. CSL10205-OR2 TaxID=2980558 RepID=UPI0021D81044|nr:pyridoxamine 5'-phosphate oxidase family protein [Streptococcus sp. CSL10205-OR2]MCU9533340.1 pyridoxamine 5'-phosphate oxidase family protein [Streptococcus sp. CSL10205-OR2]
MNITEEMKEIINAQLAMVATVDAEGNPDIGPKRSMRLYDDKTLIYNENTGGQTQENIKNNGKVAVAFVDRERLMGYRFVGKAEIQDSGELYEAAKEWAKGRMGEPKAVGVIHIERIFNLHSGDKAGTEVK